MNHKLFASLRFFLLLPTVMLVLLLLGASRASAADVVDTQTKLLPSDVSSNLFFGSSVAIDNATIAVGALDLDHGAVYVFDLVGTNWVESQKILDFAPPTLPDAFGASLALQDDLLVVGQPQGFSEPDLSGQVLLFRRTGTNWFFDQKLLELNPPPPKSGLGFSVAISGPTIVAGNPNESSIADNSGAAYIFNLIGTNWIFQTKLKASNAAPNNFLGASVAIQGDTAMAGAPAAGVNGAVYVFQRNGTNWTQAQEIIPAVLDAGEAFGSGVDIEGDLAVIGAPNLNFAGEARGGAYIYKLINGVWTFQQQLLHTVGQPGQGNNLFFGRSVSIHNGVVVIGVPGLATNGAANAGAVDIYLFDGTNWFLAQEIFAADASAGAALGQAVAIGDKGIVAGAPTDNGAAPGAGAAYVFFSSQTNLPPPTVSATPNILFPPNHKLIPVTITVENHDAFTSCRIVSVTSNEPINGKGRKAPDWIITGDLTLLLRAERSGTQRSGRVYTVTVECTDNLGNISRNNVLVTVPHDRRK